MNLCSKSVVYNGCEENTQEEQIETEPDKFGYIVEGKEHIVSVYFDENMSKYRIVDVRENKIYPDLFDSKDDAISKIYSSSTKIIGFITHDCVSLMNNI